MSETVASAAALHSSCQQTRPLRWLVGSAAGVAFRRLDLRGRCGGAGLRPESRRLPSFADRAAGESCERHGDRGEENGPPQGGEAGPGITILSILKACSRLA
jgi:hypothetical protein